MFALRTKRLFALSAAGLLMAGGAALGAAGTASAAAPTQHVSYVAGGWGHDDDHGWHHGGWNWDDDDDNGYGGHDHGDC